MSARAARRAKVRGRRRTRWLKLARRSGRHHRRLKKMLLAGDWRGTTVRVAADPA